MELPSSKTTIFTVMAFIIGGVVLPILTEMRLSTNQSKELSHKEMNVNSQYLNVINDLSESNIKKQLELAKYFSCVSTDEDTRQGWLRYYKLKKKEYKEEAENLKKLIKEQDTLKNIDNLFYKSKLNQLNIEIQQLESNLSNNNSYKDEKTKLAITKRVYIQYESKDLEEKIKENLVQFGWEVPFSEKTNVKFDKNVILYFNELDYEIANELKNLITTEKVKYEIKKINMKAPQGQLEIWLKQK